MKPFRLKLPGDNWYYWNTLIGKYAINKKYLVKGWYLDANGCLKTHSDGYKESFVDETIYE